MSTFLYLIRHGLTEWNKDRRFQGQTDIPLNDEGKKQADSLGFLLRNEPIDFWYASPLSRAKETAKRIIKHHKKEFVLDSRLKERNFGILEGQDVEIALKQYPSQYLWDYPYAQPPEGERTIEVYNRMQDFLDQILSRHRGNRIAIIAHGTPIRMALCYLTQITIPEIGRYVIKNASVSLVEYQNRRSGTIHAFNWK